MTVAVANNFTPLRDIPPNFMFENGNKPTLSEKSKASFVVPETLPRNAFVEFNLTNFNQKLKLEIIEIDWSLNTSTIIFRLKVFDAVFVTLILQGEWKGQKELSFYLNEVGINLENKSEIPISNFVAVSFWAMIGLSNKCSISIQSLDYKFSLSFDIPFDKISDLLQERELAYRLMVIEKALNTQLPFPNNGISGDDVENIAFCYHTIAEGKFDWLCKDLTFFPPATNEFKDLLPKSDIPFFLKFPTLNEQRVIFGNQLNLGQFHIVIEKARVTNYNQAKESLLKLDGNPIEIVIKPITGTVKYISFNKPISRVALFNQDIQMLIDLESKLIDAVFEKQVNSFSNAFEGLSNEQIEVLTERPILEEEAFNF